MTFQPLHCGLYFTPAHIREAQRHKAREPFLAAWENLKTLRHPAHLPENMLRDALWYRLNGEIAHETAEHNFAQLDGLLNQPNDEGASPEAQINHLLTLAQTFECMSDHPAYTTQAKTAWINHFAARVGDVQAMEESLAFVPRLRLALLTLVNGIILEDANAINAGADYFRLMIEEEVRPQGFIPKALEGEDDHGIYRQVSASATLVLMAEAATHVGINLWDFAVRGVNVRTSAIYPIYYYYTTEKWEWHSITPEAVQDAFRQHGGYLEIVHKRTNIRDLMAVLEPLRPIFDQDGGGATTLTHGVKIRTGLFG